jgi:hypothetical protein
MRQKEVTFYGDQIVAVQEPGSGAIYVPLARLCDNLGIARNRQAQRIREHPVLSAGMQSLSLDTPGGPQEAQCMRLDLIPLWLSGVNANRVGEDVREKLIRYQAEVAAVLWAAFKHEILPPGEPAAGLSGAQLAYELATAIQNLARDQMEMERRIAARLDSAAHWARQVEGRIAAIELALSDTAPITDAQAGELALAVKTVAAALEAAGTPNGYQRVYAEMYRRYSIASYRRMPRDHYDDALAWLKTWHGEIEG